MQLFNGKTITLALLVVFLYAGMTSLVNLFVENDTINHVSNFAALNTITGSTTSSADYTSQSSPDYVSPTPVSPVASFINPANNSIVSGTVNLSVLSLNSGTFTNIQFFINGSPLGQAVSSPILPYSYSWDSTQVSNGAYTLSAVGGTPSGGYSTATITVIVNNPVNSDNSASGQSNSAEPIISSVAASSITSSGAIISWVTDEMSESQVNYGLGSSYGNTTSLDQSLVTSHAEFVENLLPSTLYHYQVVSTDEWGNSSSSPDNTFTTLPSIDTSSAPVPNDIDTNLPINVISPPLQNQSNSAVQSYTYHAPPAPPLPPMKLSKNLKLNDTDPEVLLLQKTLNALGFTVATTGPGSPGKETSKFDVDTQQALMQYQETQSEGGIVPTGSIDNVTMLLLNADIAKLARETESASSTNIQSVPDEATSSVFVDVINSTLTNLGNLWITLFAKIK